MEKIGAKLFKIVFNTQIGNINEKRAEALARIFDGKFEMRIMQDQPLGKVFILANPLKREVLLIEPQSITYQLEAEESVEPNFTFINETIKNVYEVLLLDDLGPALVHIFGQEASKDGDAMLQSIELLQQNEISKSIPNLKGVGIRYIMDHETGLWEYKVEPFINNPKMFWIEMICNINTPLSSLDVIGLAEGAFVNFTVEKTEVLRGLGI